MNIVGRPPWGLCIWPCGFSIVPMENRSWPGGPTILRRCGVLWLLMLESARESEEETVSVLGWWARLSFGLYPLSQIISRGFLMGMPLYVGKRMDRSACLLGDLR